MTLGSLFLFDVYKHQDIISDKQGKRSWATRLLKRVCTILLLGFVIISCQDNREETPSQRYGAYCGSCHLLPDPRHITKDIWDEHVLPNMAARLGQQYKDFDYKRGNSMMENAYIRLSNVYPDSPVIDSLSFLKIRNYIIENAPKEIAIDTNRSLRHENLTQFEPRLIALNQGRRTGVAYIKYEEDQFRIGDVGGGMYTLRDNGEINFIDRYRSAVVSSIQRGEDTYQTEIGYMNPSEQPIGSIYKIDKNNQIQIIATDLHRPVYTKMIDLNLDGVEEIIICEYGNLTGSLSLLTQNELGVYQKRNLLKVAGAIKVDVVDMDKDGSLDIVALMAQGDEAVYIGYQKEELEFEMDKVINLPPEYGSSWYELTDIDQDGDLDMVFVNGDNIDLSMFLKPYHGLRIYLNDGSNSFEEEWFYPMYGATRIIAEDFDQDGDIDFVTTAYFPDDEHNPTESFVLFERQDGVALDFKTYTLAEAANGRWLVMEAGDYDQDGDVDVVLGSYILPQAQQEMQKSGSWVQQNVDVMLLENQHK